AVLDVVGGDAAFQVQAQGVLVAEGARWHQAHAVPEVAAVDAVEFGLERVLHARQRRGIDLRQRDQVIVQAEVGGVAGDGEFDVVRLGERAGVGVHAHANQLARVGGVLVVDGADLELAFVVEAGVDFRHLGVRAQVVGDRAEAHVGTIGQGGGGEDRCGGVAGAGGSGGGGVRAGGVGGRTGVLAAAAGGEDEGEGR